MIEIIGIIVGLIGIIFGVIEIVSKWPKIKAKILKFRDSRKLKGNLKEILRVHASSRRNVFTLKQLQSDFNSNISLNVAVDEKGISLGAYDTENSPMYLFTSFPARLLLPLPIQQGITWEETGESNMGFPLKAVSTISSVDDKVKIPAGEFICVKVDTFFHMPPNYTGPKYTQKSIWWSHGVGPVKIKVDFADSEPCIGELFEYDIVKEECFWPMNLQNKWTYIWKLSRPNNNRNVSEATIEVTANFR